MITSIKQDWEALQRSFQEIATATITQVVPPSAPHFREAVAFATGRLDEGRQVGQFFADRFKRPLRVLDIGAGNGGVAIGIANYRDNEVYAVDIIPNHALVEARQKLGARVAQIVASGHALPFKEGTFDVVLCLETVEHVPRPLLLGREIMRVLRAGGACMLMTPARVKYLFRPDPHYAIPGLLLFPDGVQRFLVTRVFRRADPHLYDVVHIFWSLGGLAGLFPTPSSVEPLFNDPRPPGTLWFRFRSFLWDRILINK